MPFSLPTNPRRALVVMLGHIGDVLVTTPVFAALKAAWPGLAITAVVNQGTQDMLTDNPDIARVLTVRRGRDGKLAMLKEQAILLGRLASGGFDLALDLSGNDRGAFLSLVSRARFRQGFAPKKNKARSRVFHQLVSKRGVSDHMVLVNLRHVEALGLPAQDQALKFFPGPEAAQKAAELLARLNPASKPLALVHPTSRWMFKSWTPEGNRQVIQALLNKGFLVITTCAPVREELDFLAEIHRSLPSNPGLRDLSGQVDLKLLGALLQRADLFFGVDSAPMHMAAALNAPTLVLFGPSGENMWGPWHTPNRVVASDDPCRPCGADGCPGSKESRCLLEMPPSRVLAELDSLLNEKGPR